MLIYLILFILSLLFMGFFEGTETAIISANRLKFYSFLDSNELKYQRTSQLLTETQKLLIITLIGTNFSLVLGTFVAKELLHRTGILIETPYLKDLSKVLDIDTLFELIVLPPFFLIFCQIIPKNIFRIKADILILKLTGVLDLFSILFTPLVNSLSLITNFILKVFGIKEGILIHKLTREDLIDIVEESEKTGAIEESECEMISSIFDLGKTNARKIMKPLIDVVAININYYTIEDLKNLAKKTGHTRFPVYEDKIINLTGYIDLYQIFSSDDIEKRILKDFINEPYYIPESKRIDHLLEEFLEKRIRIAIVIDEYGSCIGIVTREDILEEIVGEIGDEFDRAEPPEYRYEGDVIYCDAKMVIDDANAAFNLNIPEGDYDTIGGFIYSALEKIPEVGDTVTYENAEFEVVSMDKQKINKIKIKISEKNIIEEESEEE